MIHRLRALWRTWDRFWFSPADSLPLDLVRIGLGAAMLVSFGTWTPEIPLFFGGSGYMGAEAQAVRDLPWWMQSVFFHVAGDTAVLAVHFGFLAACACFCLGLFTPVAKVLVWLLHLSYLHGNPAPFYGADNIAGNMLFLLLFAPIGGRLSLDALRYRRKHGQARPPSARANAILRLIQVQLAIMYFFAGFEKLRGDLWWSGDAVWIALNNVEFMRTSEATRDWLARHYVVINLLSYGTVALECAYPFLIWKRAWRPWLLVSAILMHLGVAVMMGLWYFSSLMMLFNLVYLPFPLRRKEAPPAPA